MSRPPRPPGSKLLPVHRLVERFGRPRTGDVVFTNGVFDIMHRGHAIYLSKARALGDALLVGVNSDASARRLGKGPDRPINTEQDRALLVAALECVDAVCVFDEDTPANLIARLLPDILVKGGDYTPNQVAGGAVVRDEGGRVEIIDFVDGYSTSDLIHRIRGTD